MTDAERLARLEERMKMYDTIFAGAITNYHRIKDAEARQHILDQERRDVMGANTEANRKKIAADAEKAKKFAHPQSREGVLDGR